MTTITSTTANPYAYTSLLGTSATTTASATASATAASTAATSVTLSDAAKAALALPDFATVVTQARAALDALLVNGAKPAEADFSGLDRRQLFAISSNAQSKFTAAEQTAATAEQQNRLNAALSGPLAVARVTNDLDGMYSAALTYLDGASTEEKATSTWIDQKAALVSAQKQLAASPNATPNVDGDIVAAYIRTATAGEDTTTLRDFGAVASDARAALDKQYADAATAGKTLTFSGTQKNGQPVDFSQFDSRSLSAIALNQDAQFNPQEVFAAKQAVAQRSSATVLAGLKSAASDPASFAKNLISAYGSMSPEERQAAGWSDQLYSAAVASYNTATQIANIFGDTSAASGSTAVSFLDYMNTDESNDPSNLSLASILNGGGS